MEGVCAYKDVDRMDECITKLCCFECPGFLTPMIKW